MKITIEIECYQCGTVLSIPYDIGRDHAEYGKCQDCGEGIEVRYKAGALKVERLPEEP